MICFFRFVEGTGHFVQMIWGATSRIGCGMISHVSPDRPDRVTRYYACHYGPGGNFVGQNIYSPGSPCSKCQCSSQYPGLCQDKNNSNR